MDPQANKDEQARIRAHMKAGTNDAGDRARLRELVRALADWRRIGGFG